MASTVGDQHPRAGMRRTRSTDLSRDAFESATAVFPGGITRQTVNDRPLPIYMDRGEGPWLIDLDGNRYLDLVNNFATLIHGHAFAPVVEAVSAQLRSGACFANPTRHEIELARIICGRVPSIDKLRFVNTGTEAVMFAIKAARAYTGRAKVAKFEGAYHGSYDWAEVSEDSGPDNWGSRNAPQSVGYYAGCPRSVLDETVVLPFNLFDETEQILEAHAADLACVLIDIMPSRAGMLPIEPHYVAMLRELTRAHGIVLISDDVLNFRLDYRGAAARFGLEPDLITLGKIIGGGLPIGAIGGDERVMSVFDGSYGRPRVPQGGTFSANPLSMVAGIASMNALDPAAFQHLEALGDRARQGIREIIRTHGLPWSVSGLGSLFRIHMKKSLPKSYREIHLDLDEAARLARLIAGMRTRGINLSAHGTGTLSTPMSDEHIDLLLGALEDFAGESA